MKRITALNHTNQAHENKDSTTANIHDLLSRLANSIDHTDRHVPAESGAVTQVIAATLMAINKTLSDLDTRLAELQIGIQERASQKDWYSVAEAAADLSKAEFTVREWCRLNRINAHKRECGRGGKREWMISREELERIRNKGLLPTDL